jgi:alpha-L-rhamnosidase
LLAATAMALGFIMSPARAEDLAPVGLRCEHRVNPQGIDEAQPRLTWRVESSARGATQSAYQILVASSREQLNHNSGALWDSGQVASGQTVNVVYSGKPLASGQECFWKVGVWDAGVKPQWSAPASWTVGLLQPGDWQAAYISFRDPTPVWQDTEITAVR